MNRSTHFAESLIVIRGIPRLRVHRGRCVDQLVKCGRLIDKPRFSRELPPDSDSSSPRPLQFTMADADEDAIRGPSTEAANADTDLSDETQDFRLLNHLSLYVHKLVRQMRHQLQLLLTMVAYIPRFSAFQIPH